VAGTLVFGDSAHLTVIFVPDTLLASHAEYVLRVTQAATDLDGDGLEAPVTVGFATPDNAAPVADFTVSCTHLTCRFADLSSDPDAGDSVLARAWDFGDGQNSSEQNPTHTYADPGGRFTVTLTVTDDDGAGATAVEQVTVAMGSGPDRSGIYERETPHSAPGRDSRYVIRADGTFELHDGTGVDTTIYTGRWVSAGSWGGWAIEPGSVLILDFNAFEPTEFCGEGYGAFLLDGHMGVAYCGVMIRAGLEEGVYTSSPMPSTPGPPPPQSGQIAFVRDGRIHLASTDGGGLVQLSTGPGDGDPAWSPDGSRIAFTRSSGGTTGVFIMDADGGNVVQRTTSGGDPTWSPDGGWIAFACSDGGLCKVTAADDGTSPDTVVQPVGQLSGPAWSPDGTRIAHTSDWAMFDFWFDIWVVAPDGSNRTALTTHTPEAPNPYEHYQPAWSPGGDRIAFVTCAWAFNFCSSSAVSVMSADGSGIGRLVAATGFAGPTWSPDGQVIAFASSNAIEWVSADGRQRGRIIADGHSPAWRP
jgi:PKD repeat protein